MIRLSWQSAVWLALYGMMIVGIVIGLFQARDKAVSRLSGPEQQAHWQTFRQEMTKYSEGDGPVKRRVPKSNQPPGLLLLRDYFLVCFCGALLFGTCLFVTAMVLFRGALKASSEASEKSDLSSQDQAS